MLSIVVALCSVLCFSTSVDASAPRVLIVYATHHNHTMNLGKAIAAGATAAGAEVRFKSVEEANFTTDGLLWADAIVLGSPTHYGNPAAKMLGWCEDEWKYHWEDERMANKFGAVFATGGGYAQGMEHTLTALIRLLQSFRMKVVTPDLIRSGFFSSYGAMAVTGTKPYTNNQSDAIAPDFVLPANALGKKVVAAVAAAQRTIAIERLIAKGDLIVP